MKEMWIALISILMLASSAYAHMNVESVDTIMNQMMSSQGITKASDIDCNRISDHEFEELGDAVMDRMLNDKELHERMDVMMGGEGSVSLEQMHIAMGKSWLGCGSTSVGFFMPMMGYGMMNPYFGYNNIASTAQISLVLSIISIALVLIFGILILNKLNKRR